MTDWLFFVEEQDWPEVKAKWLFILPRGTERILQGIKEGERAFVCLMEERQGQKIPSGILGLFEVASIVEKPEGVRLRPEIVLEASRLDLEPLIQELSALRRIGQASEIAEKRVLELSSEDYDLLREKLERLSLEESMGLGISFPG